MSESEAFAAGAGVFDADFFAGAAPLAAGAMAFDVVGEELGFEGGAGLAAAGDDAGVDDVVDAGADGVESEALALAFLLFPEVFGGDASGAGAAAASLGAAASAGLDFVEDFFVFVEVVSADAVALSAAAVSDFFDFFEDFFGVDVSAAAVESADASASAFFDFFEDFFVVEESAGAEELAVVPASGFWLFFDFDDFVVAE
jgi:hypothetical protein